MSTQTYCLVCGTSTVQRCASCKSATYCSKEHQKKDWRAHKEYCLKVKAAGSNTYDAILFAENESKPRLVKIPWKLTHDVHDEVEYKKLDTSVWFKHPESEVRPILFRRLGINGPDIGRGLGFLYDENFILNESPFNQCIIDITRGKAGHPWCGNILALRLERKYSFSFYESVDLAEDLKAFVTYFEEYGKVKPG